MCILPLTYTLCLVFTSCLSVKWRTKLYGSASQLFFRSFLVFLRTQSESKRYIRFLICTRLSFRRLRFVSLSSSLSTFSFIPIKYFSIMSHKCELSAAKKACSLKSHALSWHYSAPVLFKKHCCMGFL